MTTAVCTGKTRERRVSLRQQKAKLLVGSALLLWLFGPWFGFARPRFFYPRPFGRWVHI